MIELSLERHSRDTVLKLYSLYRTVMKTKANLISYQFVILDSFNVHFLNDPIFQKKKQLRFILVNENSIFKPDKNSFYLAHLATKNREKLNKRVEKSSVDSTLSV